MKKIGEIVKAKRKALNISADELAGLMGKKGSNRKQYVYDIERGRSKRIKIEVLNQLASIFEAPLEDFITLNEDEVKGTMENLVPLQDDNGKTVQYWERKYMDAMEEISNLKSQIIVLMNKNSKQ